MFREGLLVVICGPSGVGKGTILKKVIEKYDNLKLSISATTRKPREGDVDGVSYFFKNTDEFKDMIDKGELIEWVEYCGNYYGTPKSFIDQSIQNGEDVVLEIEVKGALNIKKQFPESVMIFILPPSFEELRHRITGRGTEESEIIEKRMNKALQEMNCIDHYDYVVVNDSIDETVNNISTILKAEKFKTSRNNGILKEIGLGRNI